MNWFWNTEMSYSKILNIVLFATITAITIPANSTTNGSTNQTAEAIEINDNPNNVKSIWDKYHSTHDDKYLMQLLKYLNQDDTILIYSYEFVNRRFLCNFTAQLNKETNTDQCFQKNYKELKAEVEKHYTNDKVQKVKQFETTVVVLVIMDENRKRNKEINDKIAQIITQQPELDYVTKIDRAINPKN
jgi:hypothetical protein